MASKKPKLGARGPSSYWLSLSLTERVRTRAYLTAAFKGYTDATNRKIPSIRRIFTSFGASDGYDLRHIERWDKRRIMRARDAAERINTLVARQPFKVVTPRNKKQRAAVENYTGQAEKNQRAYIVRVQDQDKDKVVFSGNKIQMIREYPSGARSFQQIWLFRDYNHGEQPSTFGEMITLLSRMLKDMPEKIRGAPMLYTLYTVNNGQTGNAVEKSGIRGLLKYYVSEYQGNRQHAGFADVVIGFFMTGNSAQTIKGMREIAERRRVNRQFRKIRWRVKGRK